MFLNACVFVIVLVRVCAWIVCVCLVMVVRLCNRA